MQSELFPSPDVPLSSLAIERRLWETGYRHVAGLDEAGRGCLAGPVVAAAVIFPEGVNLDGLDDSKRLSAARREELAARIREEALSVGIGQCSPAEIDEINILQAALEAMRRAAAKLTPAAEYLLIDGNRCFEDPSCPADAIVKGDGRCHAIAAASIMAKTTRDRWMRSLHEKHPHFGWNTNVGYPTRAHYEALEVHGPTPYHRRSFRLARKEA